MTHFNVTSTFLSTTLRLPTCLCLSLLDIGGLNRVLLAGYYVTRHVMFCNPENFCLFVCLFVCTACKWVRRWNNKHFLSISLSCKSKHFHWFKMLTAAYHYLFSENSRAETNDTLFLSLREIIIKVMSRWFTWQSQLRWRTKNAQSSRARRNARHAFMYFSDLYALSSPSVNPLAPNDIYIRRTAQLTTRHCILNIYSTYILTEYFKHAACTFSVFFFFKMPFTSNRYFFFLVPVIFTF